MRLTGIVHREEDHFVALCPELDVVSQGDTAEEATENLREACELFLEYACDEEVQGRLGSPVQVRHFEAGGVKPGQEADHSAPTDGGFDTRPSSGGEEPAGGAA